MIVHSGTRQLSLVLRCHDPSGQLPQRLPWLPGSMLKSEPKTGHTLFQLTLRQQQSSSGQAGKVCCITIVVNRTSSIPGTKKTGPTANNEQRTKARTHAHTRTHAYFQRERERERERERGGERERERRERERERRERERERERVTSQSPLALTAGAASLLLSKRGMSCGSLMSLSTSGARPTHINSLSTRLQQPWQNEWRGCTQSFQGADGNGLSTASGHKLSRPHTYRSPATLYML